MKRPQPFFPRRRKPRLPFWIPRGWLQWGSQRIRRWEWRDSPPGPIGNPLLPRIRHGDSHETLAEITAALVRTGVLGMVHLHDCPLPEPQAVRLPELTHAQLASFRMEPEPRTPYVPTGGNSQPFYRGLRKYARRY